MKKRMFCILISAVLLNMAGCGNAETAGSVSDEGLTSENAATLTADVSYAESAGLEVLPHGDALSTGVVYYGADPENHNMQTECIITAGEVSVSSVGDTDELQIPFTFTMTGEYTDECVNYSSAITPSVCFADKYTGLILPVKDTEGDDVY